MDDTGNALVIDTSDAICADYIIERVGHGRDNSVVVVDYLQLLDQRRRNPELAVQVKTLAGFASTASTIIVAISQIDRSFDMAGRPLQKNRKGVVLGKGVSVR